jgi:hypothetical protein
MSVDRFEYPDLGVVVQRGAMGQPSTVTLEWVTVDDEGDEHDSKLELECSLLLDDVEVCRVLTISKVSGPAADDFSEYAKVLGWKGAAFEVDKKGWYEEERLHDAADALGRALLLNDAKDRFPILFVKVLP